MAKETFTLSLARRAECTSEIAGTHQAILRAGDLLFKNHLASGSAFDGQGGLDFTTSGRAVPGSGIAPALALKGPPDANIRIGEAKGRQVVSVRELRSVARGRAVPRSAEI